MLAVGAPGDVDAEVDLWRKQTIYNASQAEGIMKAYEKAYPSSKSGQKTAPVSPPPGPGLKQTQQRGKGADNHRRAGLSIFSRALKLHMVLYFIIFIIPRRWSCAGFTKPPTARKPRTSALDSGQLEGIPEEVSGWNGSESNSERISVSFSRI